MNRHLARKATVLIAFAIVVLSIIPAGLRPVVASHNFEHVAIYLALGMSAGLSYLPRFAVAICAALTCFCVITEVLQLGIPGRHARIADLATDLIASQLGFLVAILAVHCGKSRI